MEDIALIQKWNPYSTQIEQHFAKLVKIINGGGCFLWNLFAPHAKSILILVTRKPKLIVNWFVLSATNIMRSPGYIRSL